MYRAKLAKIQPAGQGRTFSFMDDVLPHQSGSDRQEMVIDIKKDWIKYLTGTKRPI